MSQEKKLGSFNNEYFGLNARQKREKILKKILEKAEEGSLKKDFFSHLASLFSNTVIGTQYYTFEGTIDEFRTFLEDKKERATSFLLYSPKIWVKREQGKGYLKLEPSGLIYHRENYSLLFFSHKVSLSYEFFSAFLFDSLCLKKYLSIRCSETVIFWFNRENRINYSFALPLVKNERVPNPEKRIHISSTIGLSEIKYSDSIFSELCTQEEYQILSGNKFTNAEQHWTERDLMTKKKIESSLQHLKDHFWERLEEIEKVSLSIQGKIPTNLASLGQWRENIQWAELISTSNLSQNYELSQKITLFSTDAKIYKKAFTFISPPFLASFLSSSLVDKKKIFFLHKTLKEYPKLKNVQSHSLKNFLPFSFKYFCSNNILGTNISKKADTNIELEDKEIPSNSIFSLEGWDRFKRELLDIKWKVYYDFESYDEILTQLSFQVHRESKLYYKKDLILESLAELDAFEKEILRELSLPLDLIIKEQSGEKNEWSDSIEKKILSKSITFIAFNKSFEAEWLKKLNRKVKCPHLAKTATLISDLTVDLSDWFKFSKNLSLNIIGALFGAHSLKKVSDLVIEDLTSQKSEIIQKNIEQRNYPPPKKYRDLEMVRDGRCAQLLYFYYYLKDELASSEHSANSWIISPEAQNKDLSPRSWIIKKTDNNASYLKESLKEYCACDVENMVLAFNWLETKYLKHRENLVSQEQIISFISWFKKLSSKKLEKLIKNYLDSL